MFLASPGLNMLKTRTDFFHFCRRFKQSEKKKKEPKCDICFFCKQIFPSHVLDSFRSLWSCACENRLPIQWDTQSRSSGNQGCIVETRVVNMLVCRRAASCTYERASAGLWRSRWGMKNGVKFQKLLWASLSCSTDKHISTQRYIYLTHTHTQSAAESPPFHGCLSHILSFCLVSPAADR